jgi:urease subunit gamma/beta
MRLTPWEEERLVIFSAAELARRHRERGLPLNAPETIALICDAMLEAARGGAGYAEIEAAGRAAVSPEQVMDGVRTLVDEVRLEVLVGDGTRLVVLLDPLGRDGQPPEADGPGAMRPAALVEDRPPAPPLETRELTVRSESQRTIRVSSHYPFHRVNPRLVFDRAAARGFRLDLPAGASQRWAPGESHTVRLVRYGGEGDEANDDGGDGHGGSDGSTDDATRRTPRHDP